MHSVRASLTCLEFGALPCLRPARAARKAGRGCATAGQQEGAGRQLSGGSFGEPCPSSTWTPSDNFSSNFPKSQGPSTFSPWPSTPLKCRERRLGSLKPQKARCYRHCQTWHFCFHHLLCWFCFLFQPASCYFATGGPRPAQLKVQSLHPIR